MKLALLVDINIIIKILLQPYQGKININLILFKKVLPG